MIADNITRREAPNPGVHVRTLYRIRKGQHPDPWPEPPHSEAQVRLWEHRERKYRERGFPELSRGGEIRTPDLLTPSQAR